MGAALRSAIDADLNQTSDRRFASPARIRSTGISRTQELRLIVGGASSQSDVLTIAPLAERQDAVVSASSFDDAERMAIAIGRNDPRFQIDPRSCLGRSLWVLFGLRGPNPLADPKLEALRRLALALRRRTGRTGAAVDAALAAGIAQAKIDFLLA